MLVKYEFENNVSRITLNRPEKRNALSSQLIDELISAVDRAHHESGSRLTLIQAEGPVFCAGMDLKEMQQRAESADASDLYRQDSKAYRDLIVKILEIETPVVAGVQGAAVAGGMGIVMACDLVVATDNASLSLPEPKRGIVAGMVMPLLLYRGGVSAANRLLLSLESIDATEALRMNFVHVVVNPADYNDRVRKLCDSVLSGGPEAMRITKSFLAKITRENLISSLDASIAISAVARDSAEAHEGLAAFLEKRTPDWQ